MLVVVLMSGAFSSKEPGNTGTPSDNSGSIAGSNADTGKTPPPSNLEGTDVFRGERFQEMLWSYYELDNYDYTGSSEDTAQFRKDMQYIPVAFENNEQNISVLPVGIHFGCYTHFLGTFTYEDTFYEPYTELGRAMFRKAYIEQYGDLSEEDFAKLEKILDLNVAELTVCAENGATFRLMLAYQLEGNFVSLYTVSVDEKYNITMGEEPLVQYEFLHDGGKLTLACKGLQRTYRTSGYKETDSSLSFSGYAPDASQQYGDLEGFSMYQYGVGEEISAYPKLVGGETPVDPSMELDVNTGAFTLKWTQRWVKNQRYLEKKDDPTAISGTIIPVTNYGFTDYSGFIMFIDGQMYKYLMSEEEYEERLASISESENLSDTQKEDLANAKRNILKELEEAFRAAGISATVDYNKGQIALEASFLFATNSYELSAEGKTYLDKFVDAYSSVVFKDDYSDYISRIVVEGHTDTKGSYSMNQKLSQNRADTVAQQCISRNSKMANIVQSVGCSYDYPVYKADGTVDMDASRRVTFRFVFAG